MELQLVTSEQAKALKEVGFPLEYEEIEYEEPWGGFNSYISDKPILPPLELVAKWLRECKNIHVVANPSIYKDAETYHYAIVQMNKTPRGKYGFKTFEDALSAGIDEVINILKNECPDNNNDHCIDR